MNVRLKRRLGLNKDWLDDEEQKTKKIFIHCFYS